MKLNLLVWALLSYGALGGDILTTGNFKSCQDNSSIQIQNLDVSFDRARQKVVFNVAGSSAEEQRVSARLSVNAYGKEVFSKDFNPCDDSTKISQLCPALAGAFTAHGQQDIPSRYISQIPALAFDIPDLEGFAKLELQSVDDGKPVACIESNVVNGKSTHIPAIGFAAAGIAGCALILSSFSALGSAGPGGGHAPTPTFGTVVNWFQGMVMNGMLSVDYPPVYQHFTRNFAFAGGLVPWNGLQTSIDRFRKATSGDMAERNNRHLDDVSSMQTGSTEGDLVNVRRGLETSLVRFEPYLVSRDTKFDVHGQQGGNDTSSTGVGSNTKMNHYVSGIQGYVEQLSIPQANTFMTVLLVLSIVIATIAVSILFFKVILEFWALFTSFPTKLKGFRKRYWGLLGRTITNLILILYGVWTLYCVFQFTNGGSWAATTLAAVTWTVFTVLLLVFTFKIWQLAQRSKRLEGDTSALFENKSVFRRYGLFYDNYKRDYYWVFVPAIVYMYAKGSVIAGANGHGLVQTVGQLIIESLMLALILWELINIIIQVVRLLSVALILVFVEELGINQSSKTITGVVLIALQSSLTALLALLIAINAIVICVRENPHRKRRKEAEKRNRDMDNLTSLEPRNTMLIDSDLGEKHGSMHDIPLNNDPLPPMPPLNLRPHVRDSRELLIKNASPMGRQANASSGSSRSPSQDSGTMTRQLTLTGVDHSAAPTASILGTYRTPNNHGARTQVRRQLPSAIPDVLMPGRAL